MVEFLTTLPLPVQVAIYVLAGNGSVAALRVMLAKKFPLVAQIADVLTGQWQTKGEIAAKLAKGKRGRKAKVAGDAAPTIAQG